MTTVSSAYPERRKAGSRPEDELSVRQRQRLEKRRLLREEILAVLILALVLAVTLALLGLEWLASGSTTTTSSSLAAHISPGGFA